MDMVTLELQFRKKLLVSLSVKAILNRVESIYSSVIILNNITVRHRGGRVKSSSVEKFGTFHEKVEAVESNEIFGTQDIFLNKFKPKWHK